MMWVRVSKMVTGYLLQQRRKSRYTEVIIQSLRALDYKKTPWLESASELYRQSDRRLSAKLVATFADRGCHVVSVTDPYGRILGFSRPVP
jgi:hypothetical protein